MLASFKTSSSNPSPLITIVLFNSLAINSALSLFFSIIFTLTPSVSASKFLARLKPILPPPTKRIFLAIFSSWPKAESVLLIWDAFATTKALSSTNNLSFFLSITNFSPLITPSTFALRSGNRSVNLPNSVFVSGQFLSILISKTFILPLANGTLSKAPGASNFRCNDLATSNSGEIITSIGKLAFPYNFPHLEPKNSWPLILAIFLLILKIE